MATRAVPERCSWAGSDPLYVHYHDFEFLVLESAQAGLSWITILRKREAYRKAYRGFDPRRVARFGARDVARLLADTGIVRNRAKIEASIGNARAFLAIQAEFGSFDRWLYARLGGRPAKALKERGFRFLGPTIIYSHLQAVGAVNDHVVGCFRWKACGARAPTARTPR
jgi:DNA-3-methyladenine glycosylase I